MQTLRDRQIREVLDEDLNINRRVNDLTNRKVRLSEEVIAPRKTRDTEIEVSVDKLIENLNKTLETKTTALEYLLTRITRGEGEIGDAEGRRAFNLIVNNGDFITAYNQLIRLYTQPSLSRTSQEIIKTKFQELSENINAILYGLSECIQYLFQEGVANKDIFQLVRSQAVYDFVKQALFRGSSYKIIEQADISTSVQNVLADLSDVQRAELKRLSEGDLREKSLLKLPIEVEQNKAYLDALEDEIGFKFPENLRRTVGRKELASIESEYGRIQGDITAKDRKQLDEYISNVRREDASLLKTLQALLRQSDQLVADRAEELDDYRARRQDEIIIDIDDGDQKHELEDKQATIIAKYRERLDELENEIDRIRARREEIGNRISDLKQQFETRLETQLDTQAPQVQKIFEGVKKKEFAVERDKPALTEVLIREKIKGMNTADSRLALDAIIEEYGINYRPQAKTEIKAIIKNVLDKYSAMKKEEAKRPPRDRPPLETTPFLQKLRENLQFQPQGEEEKYEEEEEPFQGEGKPSRVRRRIVLSRRPLDFQDGRNDIFKVRHIKGKGVFTDDQKRFAETFS